LRFNSLIIIHFIVTEINQEGNIDDVTLPRKMLTSSPNSVEESSEESAEESDFQPRKSNLSKKKVPKLPTSIIIY